jgi:hypothetical protein
MSDPPRRAPPDVPQPGRTGLRPEAATPAPPSPAPGSGAGQSPAGAPARPRASASAPEAPASPPRDASPGAPPAPGSPDEAIPMLTEIVQVPRYAVEDLPETLDEVDWSELGERVRVNVTERLTRRSQALLDAQLRDSLEAVVDRAAESLAAELRASLSQMVRDIVARAVTEELTRVHAEIARRKP